MDWTSSPLDWNNTVAIAIITQRANISGLDQRYGGEIYFNPGGPGASGTDYLRTVASHMRRILDKPEAHNSGLIYDFVSFDPRGTAHSTPRVSCFDDSISRQLWRWVDSAYSYIDSSDAALHLRWAKAQGLSEKCRMSDEHDDWQAIKGYVTTTSVVRDMVEILEKSGELREKNVIQELASRRTCAQGDEVIPDYLRYRKGHETLQYWRMILDGNTFADDWVERNDTRFLLDTDAAFDFLFQSCFEGGPENCPLYLPQGPAAMRQRVIDFISGLKAHPIPIFEPNLQIPDLLTYDNIRARIFEQLSFPYASFPTLANNLASLLSGNTSSAGFFLLNQRLELEIPECIPKSHDCAELWVPAPEYFTSVICTDGPDLSDQNVISYRDWLHSLQILSPLFAAAAADGGHIGGHINCYSWPVRPKLRFSGPFGGNTSHPILWIGNRADPVTPLNNAVEMAKKFPGARVLVQDSVGHMSLSSPSVCTIKYVRQYFQTGELPEEGTVCTVDRGIFVSKTELRELVDDDDLAGAVESIASMLNSQSSWICSAQGC
ncbi:TAP-like protein-domain-containing protein [Xylariales sp. PMI_506]|nr:TAP-like protein-domain-containing protein [Xylariales sp. PMI_506]